MTRILRRVLVCATVAVLASIPGSGLAGPPARARVVVLGFDGASADRVERLVTEGKLPNLAALAARGGYARLATSNPAQSPVAWASLATGWNPGRTGIFDFLRRYPTKDGKGITIDTGLSERRDVIPISAGARAALVAAAGAVGAAAGVGLAFAIYAGARRARRPRGFLERMMTGAGALFASIAYVTLQWVPATVPTAHNLRSGEPFWVTLDRAGVRCVALEAPLSFPADAMHAGCCLAGLGTPDVLASWGTYAVWTDDKPGFAKTETGGVVFYVDAAATTLDLVLAGPLKPGSDDRSAARAARAAGAVDRAVDKATEMRVSAFDATLVRRRLSEAAAASLRMNDRVTAHVEARIDRGRAVHLTTAEGVTATLAPGVWSELVPIVFHITPVVPLRARARFLLQSAGTDPAAKGEPWRPLRIFVAPVQFDPLHPPPNVGLSSPPEFATELAHANGVFETLGWPEMTNPVKDAMLDDRAFLDHIEIVRTGREKRLMERLARDDWDCLFAMFGEPDRVQHALYRHVDPESPRHDAKAAQVFGGEIDRSYVQMDRLVGEVVAATGPGTQILVCSDHGFAPFRRGVNLNNFLVEGGWQKRIGPADRADLFDLQGGPFFAGVRWDETKAYSMGLGNLYLNLAGREPVGAVASGDAEQVLAEIEKALLALRDADGTKVVRRVYRGKDLYRGARAAEAPDLVVGFEWGYRVSWQSCLGHVDAAVVTDNVQNWSGDHCSVDPSLVPGILFASLPLDPTAKPSVEDVAPTVLSLFGVAPNEPDGRSVLAR